MSESGEAKQLARAIAAADARGFREQTLWSSGSGLNGLPFSMPMACMWKRSSGVKTSAGSSLTSWASISKNVMVSEWIVSIGWPEPLRNSIFGGSGRLGQRVDLDLLHERHGLVGLPVHLEPAQEVIDAVGRRLDDEVALRHVARVTRREKQVFAALALVRSERADVREKTLQRIHRRPKHLWRGFDDGRTVALQVEEAHAVHRLGVRREHERLGVHERLPDDDLVGALGPEVANAAPRFDDADGRDLREVDLNGPIELELIEQSVGCRGRGVAVLELEVAEPGLDRLVPIQPCDSADFTSSACAFVRVAIACSIQVVVRTLPSSCDEKRAQMTVQTVR